MKVGVEHIKLNKKVKGNISTKPPIFDELSLLNINVKSAKKGAMNSILNHIFKRYFQCIFCIYEVSFFSKNN